MAKSRNSLAEQNTLSLFPHFQLDPSKQVVPKRADDSFPPTHSSQDEAFC